jgi:energy-coupling factor transporter ATP-binding protein EcfA2
VYTALSDAISRRKVQTSVQQKMVGLLFSIAPCERRSDDHKTQEESKMEYWDIEARGLTKKFGSFTAAHNLNLLVPRGTIFGFLGPNGSGKSTTVKMLTGLLTPTEGEALIAGEPVAVENVALKHKIGVLPEDDALFRALTIWEHLEMSGPLYGLSHEETEARATQLLRHLDLWRERGTYVEQASFGAPHPVSFQAIILIAFSINMSLPTNSFGLDEPPEINRYLLFPLRGRDILLVKNLGFAIIVWLQLSLTLPFAFWRLGWREVFIGLIEAAALSFAYLAWGNMDSVSAPYKMRFYRDTGGGSIFDALIGMTLCSLPGVAIIYLTQFNSELLAAKLVSVLALTAFVYLVSLHFAGRKFERDWQKISYRLS